MSEAERPDLDALCRYWQGVLRLQDWEVIVRYERHLDTEGRASISHDYKRAYIRIVDPIDWQNTWRPQDIEHALVHELLHLHFAPFKTENDSPLGAAEEQAVESLARAFVKMNRRAA